MYARISAVLLLTALLSISHGAPAFQVAFYEANLDSLDRQEDLEASPEGDILESPEPDDDEEGAEVPPPVNEPRGGSVFDGDGAVPDEDSAACFPSSATVELASGKVVHMSDISLGDVVRVSHSEFSPVFAFTHRDVGAVSDFMRLETASGSVLRASAGHYVYLSGELRAAASAVVGDLVQTAAGNEERIRSVTVEKNVTGLYNPQTVHGDIVVDGVLASTYTMAVEPTMAHAVLSPLRALYGLFGMGVDARSGAPTFASILPNGAVALN